MSTSTRWPAFRQRFASRVGPIGIDFLGDRVYAVQLEGGDSPVELREVRSVRSDCAPETLVGSRSKLRSVLDELFRRSRFKGRRVVTRVLSEDLRLMVLSYKLDSAMSESEQIMGLSRERMRDDLSGHVVDFVPIRTSGDQQGDRSALVAVAPEEPVIQQLEGMRRAGLQVAALEIAPVAIWRVFATLVNRPTLDVALVVQLGRDSTQLTLLSGRRMLLYRDVEIGFSAVVDGVAKALDCDAEAARDLLASYGVGNVLDADHDELEFGGSMPGVGGPGDIVSTLRETVRPALRGIVEQAHKAVSYAAFQTRGMTLDTVYLMAGASPCPGLAGLLSEMLQIPVQTFEPLAALPGGRRVTDGSHEQSYAAALGMALRGMSDV